MQAIVTQQNAMSEFATARTLIFALACMLLVFGYFFVSLQMSTALVHVDDCILGADAETYYQGLITGDWGVFRFRKHPLAVALIYAFVMPLGKLGIALPIAAQVVLAGVTSIGALALFLLLRLLRLPDWASLAVVFATLSAFGTLAVFSVVETYGVTFAAAAMAMLCFAFLGRAAAKGAVVSGILAGVVGAVPGWANLPAVAFVLVYAGFAWANVAGNLIRKYLSVVALPALVAVFVALLPVFYADAAEGFAWQKQYVERYASLSNFLSPGVVANYVLSFLVFSFVSPDDAIRSAYIADDLGTIAASPLRLASLLAVASLLGWGLWRALRNMQTRPVAVSALGAGAAFFLFYLYFNPVEAVLYSSQWILILFFAAALGFATFRPAALMFAGLAVLLVTVNAPPLNNPLSADPLLCGIGGNPVSAVAPPAAK